MVYPVRERGRAAAFSDRRVFAPPLAYLVLKGKFYIMAYRIDQSGNKTQSPLTASETAAYKTWAASLFGASFVAGITDAAQLAGVLNAQRSAGNPQPQGTVQAGSLPRESVKEELTKIAVEFSQAGQASAAQSVQFIWQQVNSNPQDPIPLASVQTFAAQVAAIAGSTPTTLQTDLTAALAVPDPDYAGTVEFGPLSALVFGGWLVVETSDCAALLTA